VVVATLEENALLAVLAAILYQIQLKLAYLLVQEERF